MILNPQTKKILCFGDSLTWWNHFGWIRFDRADRWTYRLQNKLGEDYEIIEEWLRARTVNIEDAASPGRCGFRYFCTCIESQGNIDILVILLGTNDTKKKFWLHADQILDGLRLYIDFVRKYDEINHFSKTEIVLMSPPKIKVDALGPDTSFDTHSAKVLQELNTKEKSYCADNGVHFISLYDVIEGNIHDWIHLEVNDNEQISQLLFEKIHTISL